MIVGYVKRRRSCLLLGILAFCVCGILSEVNNFYSSSTSQLETQTVGVEQVTSSSVLQVDASIRRREQRRKYIEEERPRRLFVTQRIEQSIRDINNCNSSLYSDQEIGVCP